MSHDLDVDGPDYLAGLLDDQDPSASIAVGKGITPTRTATFLAAGDISLAAPLLLIRGMIPRGAITIFAGAPGVGKGVAMADIIARGSRGDPMPNGDRLAGPFGTVIVCGAGEDGATDWQLRLVAARADPARYRLVEVTVDDIGDEFAIGPGDLTR